MSGVNSSLFDDLTERVAVLIEESFASRERIEQKAVQEIFYALDQCGRQLADLYAAEMDSVRRQLVKSVYESVQIMRTILNKNS